MQKPDFLHRLEIVLISTMNLEINIQLAFIRTDLRKAFDNKIVVIDILLKKHLKPRVLTWPK